MSRRIPSLETERLIIRELTMADLEAINHVLNQAFGSAMPLSDHQRWLQWTVLGYEMFSALGQPHYGERVAEWLRTIAVELCCEWSACRYFGHSSA